LKELVGGSEVGQGEGAGVGGPFSQTLIEEKKGEWLWAESMSGKRKAARA